MRFHWLVSYGSGVKFTGKYRSVMNDFYIENDVTLLNIDVFEITLDNI